MNGFDELIQGYRRFRRGAYSTQRARFDTLAHQGQSPKVMVVACSDSRVDPTMIFDSGPGEMFVVRNVANLVPPFETGGGRHGVSAALEFAVTQLEVSEIVVMGHGSCGGVKASLSDAFKDARPGEGGFIAHWMDLLDEERDRVRTAAALHPDMDAQRALEQAAVRVSLKNLRTFPCIADREARGTLTLRGAYFAIADGILHLLDAATDRFQPVPLNWSDSDENSPPS
jgi:carbonic anhydrase